MTNLALFIICAGLVCPYHLMWHRDLVGLGQFEFHELQPWPIPIVGAARDL